MAFTSTIQILKINPVASGVSVKTGKPWERHTAEAMLLNDDGSIEVVGKLNIPKDLRGSIKEGIYRASFSFYVPGMGDSKGEISTTLVGLMAVPQIRFVLQFLPLVPPLLLALLPLLRLLPLSHASLGSFSPSLHSAGGLCH